jgi:hypothetical protein
MIDRETPLEHQFLDISIAQGITQIPADTTYNDFGLEVAPFERG